MLKVVRDRANLVQSLHDTRSVVRSLELIIGVGIHIVFFFLYLLIFQVASIQIFKLMLYVMPLPSFSLSLPPHRGLELPHRPPPPPSPCLHPSQVDVMKTVLSFSSLLVSFSFIWGPSIRATLENAVFLFVVHP